MERRSIWIIFILGLVLLLTAGVGLINLEVRIPPGEPIWIQERGGDSLAGTYYHGSVERGVILTEGFGSDQIALRSLVGAFAERGYHILTFDFSGHGRSPGGLGFDNAQTDRLALQILDTKEIFKSLADLEDSRILLAGHSLGARAALQSAVLDDNPPAGLVLLGTQVNLVTNLQAEVFTGVADADLDWVQALGPDNPKTKILLISGEWDDILTPEAADLLLDKLEGGEKSRTEADDWRKLLLIPGVLHNYEIYSQKVLQEVIAGADAILGENDDNTPSVSGVKTRYLSWLAGIPGLFLLISGISGFISSHGPDKEEGDLELIKPGPFFLAKIIFWIPALIPAAVLGGIIFLLPLGNPAFNLIYISFLGGYGILTQVIYAKSWMPGMRGKLNGVLKIKFNKELLISLLTLAFILAGTGIFARSGWFYVLPANHRLIWAFVFTPITALGFWIGRQENQALVRYSKNPAGLLIANTLAGLLPFFLYAGFLAAIGSISGVIGAIQGLLILFFAITCGELIQRIGKNPLLTSLTQSFLIYWLILAQGVLFL